MPSTLLALALGLFYALLVNAESHTIRFVNNCGHGTPHLVQAGNILSNGSDFTSNGPFQSSIAYLQTGSCLLNGENCMTVEMNMNNPACPGCGSSVDLSLIPSHAFNVETGFAFFGGDGNQCDGLGAVCTDANCDTAFHQSNDNQVQRACQSDNVNLLITFCGGGASRFTEAVAGSLSGQPAVGAGGGSQVSTSKAATPAPAPSSSPAAAVPAKSSPAATHSSASSTPSAAVPVNVGADSGNSSGSSSGKTCSRKKLKRSKRSLSAKNGHTRSRARARAFDTHAKF